MKIQRREFYFASTNNTCQEQSRNTVIVLQIKLGSTHLDEVINLGHYFEIV